MGTRKSSSPCSGIGVRVAVKTVQLIFSDVVRSVWDALWWLGVGGPTGSSSSVSLSGGVLGFGPIMSLKSS